MHRRSPVTSMKSLPTPWLGDRRGHLVDWATQRWVQATGRRIAIAEHPWLDGPTGPPDGIGRDYFEVLAQQAGLRARSADPAGLMTSFGSLAGPGFEPSRIRPEVQEFYEATSRFELDAWSQWSGLFRPFGRLVAFLFSRRLRQLNLPLEPLSTARGMASRIVLLEDPTTGRAVHTGWVRENRATGEVVYIGAYSVVLVPGHLAPCVKVVFPLPNGNATVVLRPSLGADGSLELESAGEKFGDPGFYFIVRRSSSESFVRYLRTFREMIRVYCEDDALRTDHTFTLWRRPALRLHYRLRQRVEESPEPTAPAAR